VLVLSETAGAAEELRDAIQVNPARPGSLVTGLRRALDLPRRELRARASRMQQHIERFTVQKWAADFLSVLQAPRSLASPALPLTGGRTRQLLSDYHRAGKRLILLDYDGTLREFVDDPMAAKPTREILRLLQRLGSNPQNDVVMVSGRGRENIADWFGNLPIALAAEHGAYFRLEGRTRWHRTASVNKDWQRPVSELFDRYVARVPGALVEHKNAAVVWHYRAARPYDAARHLVGLRRELKPLLDQYGLVAKTGNKVLEVHPAGINKGRTAQEWLIHDHDFVLALGDDKTDEDTFTALPPAAYSIKVGGGQTAARFRVKDVRAVLGLLGKL